jgi:phosphoribosylpyrophosphate synthetase
MATHAVLSEKENQIKPLKRMIKAGAKKFITTDTIYREDEQENMIIYSIAPAIAEYLRKI